MSLPPVAGGDVGGKGHEAAGVEVRRALVMRSEVDEELCEVEVPVADYDDVGVSGERVASRGCNGFPCGARVFVTEVGVEDGVDDALGVSVAGEEGMSGDKDAAPGFDESVAGRQESGNPAEAVVVAVVPGGMARSGVGSGGDVDGVDEEAECVHCGLGVAPVGFLRADYCAAFEEAFDGATLGLGVGSGGLRVSIRFKRRP